MSRNDFISYCSTDVEVTMAMYESLRKTKSLKIYFSKRHCYIGYHFDGYYRYICVFPMLVIRWSK